MIKGKRVWLFRVISVTLPFVIIILLEVLLRIANYGDDLRLFKTDLTGKYYYLNPQIGKKYFANITNSTNGNMEFFSVNKSPETYRIFVLGSSTTLGFPYMYNGAFPRILKYKVQQLYPNIKFEVINLSISAINSFAVLDMAKEIVDFQPDAVLIYCGQNEYHGTLGVASSGSLNNSSFFKKAFIWSKHLRIMQFAYNQIYSTKKNDISGDLHKTLMERLAHDQKVEYGSVAYQKGIKHFRNNLEDIIEVFIKKDVPVYLGNLFTNVKDVYPLYAEEISQDSAFAKAFEEGLSFLYVQDTISSLDAFLRAYSIDSTHALCCYHLGRIYYDKGEFDPAKKYFVQSKQYDQLRFRAPEEFNGIIEKTAAKYHNVHLVNLTSKFEKTSPAGIIGNELLLEHVHPNLTGYTLMADNFLETMLQDDFFSLSRKVNIDEIASIKPPFTKFDTLFGYISNILLKENWPFNEPLPQPTADEQTYEGKVAGGLAVKQYDWKEAMEKLLKHYISKQEYDQALKIAEGLCLEFPYDGNYFEVSAKLSLKVQNDDLYLFYLTKIWSDFSKTSEIAEQIYITALKTDKPEIALPYLKFNSSSQPHLKPLLQSSEEICKLKAEIKGDDEDLVVINKIADLYINAGNYHAGKKYIDLAFELDEVNPVAIGQKELVEKRLLQNN